jgi:metal-responsive CopG/Arc/MetJ family transcriptional regulator
MAKILVSLDDALLTRIDRAAKKRGMSRSAYLASLAERDIARTRGPGTKPSVRRAMAELDRLFRENPIGAGDSTAIIRADRDAH